ncbi:hypothetical protein [Algoriphagus boritolerans]|uniref:hypothetical protein n=1 Tax=Algoriphagus boritolerans TaxID=308111 RepID=UPI002FCE5DD3
MKNEFFGSMWQFSRNMTIVRENGNLTIINSVRLNDAALSELDRLGKVTNVSVSVTCMALMILFM